MRTVTRTHNKYVIVIVHSRRIASMDNEICRHGKAEFTPKCHAMLSQSPTNSIRFYDCSTHVWLRLRWNIVNVRTRFHLLIQFFMKNIFQINNASWYRFVVIWARVFSIRLPCIICKPSINISNENKNRKFNGWNGEIAWNVVHTHFHVLMY